MSYMKIEVLAAIARNSGRAAATAFRRGPVLAERSGPRISVPAVPLCAGGITRTAKTQPSTQKLFLVAGWVYSGQPACQEHRFEID
jgi:hypothetical protein